MVRVGSSMATMTPSRSSMRVTVVSHQIRRIVSAVNMAPSSRCARGASRTAGSSHESSRSSRVAVAGAVVVVVVGVGVDDGVVGEDDGAVVVGAGAFVGGCGGRGMTIASAIKASARSCSAVVSGPWSPRSAVSCFAASCSALVNRRPSSGVNRILAVYMHRGRSRTRCERPLRRVARRRSPWSQILSARAVAATRRSSCCAVDAAGDIDQGGFVVGAGDAGDRPDLRIRQFAPLERGPDQRQRRQGVADAELLPGRVHADTAFPRQPMRRGATPPPGPALAVVELRDQQHQPRRRRRDLPEQFADLGLQPLRHDASNPVAAGSSNTAMIALQDRVSVPSPYHVSRTDVRIWLTICFSDSRTAFARALPRAKASLQGRIPHPHHGFGDSGQLRQQWPATPTPLPHRHA